MSEIKQIEPQTLRHCLRMRRLFLKKRLCTRAYTIAREHYNEISKSRDEDEKKEL